MTYNFDPDRWLELRRAFEDRRFREGEIDEETHRRALDALEARYRSMWRRLDGHYRIPDRDD